MTDDELDTARMYEAQRRHGGGLMTAESMAKCAAMLGRTGWQPTDPDLVLAREVCIALDSTLSPTSIDHFRHGTHDSSTKVQLALVAIRATKNGVVEPRLDVPEIHDFVAGAVREAAYQRQLWAADHDAGKTPEDWFWLIGYLGGKALRAAKTGDKDKALHHTISTAAALANWHAALSGHDNTMRPGIEPPVEVSAIRAARGEKG